MSDTNRSSARAGAIVRIVIWVVVLCLLMGVFAFFMLERPWSGGWNVFFGSYRYDDTGYSIGSADITDTIRSLDIDWTAGEVEIIAYDGEQLTLRETWSDNRNGNDEDDDNLMRWQVKNGKLTVKYCKPYVGLFHVSAKTLTVQVPAAWLNDEVKIDTASAKVRVEGLAADMNELDIDTASGQITLTDVYAADINVDTASGDVVTKRIRADEADFDSASGSVTVQGTVEELNINTVSGSVTVDVTGFSSGESQPADSRTVSVETVSGSITVNGRIQALELSTVSGRMNMTLDTAARTVSLDTVSGDMILRLPDTVSGFTVDIGSVSGDLSVNGFATEGGNRHKTYGDGSMRIDIDSTSGNVTVEKMAAVSETN